MIISDANGIHDVQDTLVTPTVIADAYLQAVSSLNAATISQEATVAQALADQTAEVKAQLAKLKAIMAADPATASIIQPIIDSAASQFPLIVATLN